MRGYEVYMSTLELSYKYFFQESRLRIHTYYILNVCLFQDYGREYRLKYNYGTVRYALFFTSTGTVHLILKISNNYFI